MKVQFQTVDVFTDRQFGGNPLAVIPDARRLSDAQMQAIANEFNLAETTFVLPPSDSANTARVRIFTPRAEMPFAGHPNVGTAFVLARHDSVCGVRFNRRNMIFEEIAGLVRMTIDTDDDLAEGADFQSRMFAPLHGVFEDPATGSANVALIGLPAHLRHESSAGSRHWSRRRFGTTEPDAGCCGKGCRRSHPDFDWRRLQAGDVRLDRSAIGLSG
jgi:predicted PhzF superfamily epimerase YddE/YHI9